jgi:exonuclease SbcD
MKILHFADLHLGMETYGSIDPATGLSTRLLDILKALDAVVDYAIKNEVDLVLFCGDAYKNRDPSQTQQRELAKRIKLLSQNNIPVFLLVGNHDLPNAAGRANAVEIFDTLGVDNIYSGSRFDTYKIGTRHGDIQVVALPWLRRSALLSKEEYKDLSIDEVNEKLQEIMTLRLTDLSSRLDPQVPTVLAAHISVSTAKSGSEMSMLVGRDPILLVSNVAQPVFDYVALGHIHRRQVLQQNPPVVYSGSLERLEFGDEDEDKGFYIVDIESGGPPRKVSYDFQRIEARRFLTIKANIAEDDLDPTGTILKALNQRQEEIAGAVVRLQISIPKRSDNLIRDADVYKVVKEAYHVTIGREVRQESRRELQGFESEKLTPLEALKVYLEIKKVPEERIKVLLEYAENMLKERTIGDIEIQDN